MKKVGIIIDGWKLFIYKKHLKKNGYDFYHEEGPVKDSILITVMTNDADGLEQMARVATKEASKLRMH